MDTFELLKQLSDKPKDEIKYALLVLMKQGNIDFIDLNQAYVLMLEHMSEDQDNKLVEAETCILESFFNDKGDNTHTQRCLYFLNKSKRFNMESMNDKYKYDETVGKAQSWYEQNKI